MIEKIIHIFNNDVGYNEEHYNNFLNNKNILDDYEFILWTDKKIDAFIKDTKIDNDNLLKYVIVSYYGGFSVDLNYVFFKKIDVFLDYDFLVVYNNNSVKFFGSSKNNNIINQIFKRFGNFKEEYFKKMNVKIINPIYLYPQLKTSYYIVVENNKNYIFGASKKDSKWVFSSNKLTGKINRFNYSTKNYKFYNLKNTIKNTSPRENLVVIAHPDDEILWFGEFLIKNAKNTKVICPTNNYNSKRREEYKKILNKYNIDYEMWNMTERPSYSISKELTEKLKNSIKNHKNIYTHSLSGETGHPTHILLSKILYDIVPENLFVANPYNYHNKASNKKRELLKEYSSQKKVINNYLYISNKEDYLKIK